MRKKLKNFAARLDLDAYTPSDFCVMGSSMDFDSFSIADMKKEVDQVFRDKYKTDGIVYVNPAYKIGDIYDLMAKKDELGKCLMLVDNYKKVNKMNDTKFREYQEDPDNCPDDFPKRKTGLFSSEIIITEKMEEEMKEIQAEIDKLTDNVSDDNTDTETKRSNFTGIVFVVLKTQKDMYKVLKG